MIIDMRLAVGIGESELYQALKYIIKKIVDVFVLPHPMALLPEQRIAIKIMARCEQRYRTH